jgi:hypothetical protein
VPGVMSVTGERAQHLAGGKRNHPTGKRDRNSQGQRNGETGQ